MILIFGGAYQGKLDYAKKNFEIETVCDCSDGAAPDFTADAIYGIDGFVKRCACNRASSIGSTSTGSGGLVRRAAGSLAG